MRKLFVFNMVTLDGYFAGLNGEIDWHHVDAEFNTFAIKQLDTIGTLLFGRVTYDLMAGYWSTRDAIKNDPIVAGKMNAMPKIVFSRSLTEASWNNTTLMTKDLEGEVKKLKSESINDIAIFGSGTLVTALTNAGLIDEYRLMVNPVVLGKGKPLFNGVNKRMDVKLMSARTFGNGNELLIYKH